MHPDWIDATPKAYVYANHVELVWDDGPLIVLTASYLYALMAAHLWQNGLVGDLDYGALSPAVQARVEVHGAEGAAKIVDGTLVALSAGEE